jgi:hypothetical protein
VDGPATITVLVTREWPGRADELAVARTFRWPDGRRTTVIVLNALALDGYDLPTIVAHEIGHALGLGHTHDARSLMQETVRPGQALYPTAPAPLCPGV